MSNLHEKSPCCGAGVHRFGTRRRQCTACRKTWRVWKVRRGRKRLRASLQPAQRFIAHRALPVRTFPNRNKRQYRLALSRHRCASTPWPQVPSGTLIAIADALVKYVQGSWHTWYFILVRTPKMNEAVILPFFHRKGTETATGWCEAFAAVNTFVLGRIVALVSDGHSGLVTEAKWRNWLLQRCHFHLIARIQSRRSKWKSSRHYEEGKHLYELVKRVLTEPDDALLQPLINELEAIGWQSSSRDLRNVLRGFVNHHQEFRTYLRHPVLRLPLTNNTAETFIGLIEEVCSRARGFNRVEVLDEWIACIIKTRKTIRCRPPKSTN